MSILRIGIVLVFLFSLTSVTFATEQYGFYESSKGSEYKEFRHNIFGFSIDIPKHWVFGIVTKDQIPVVLLYPEGLDTGRFSSEYETIEIGEIPSRKKVSLTDAKKYVLDGMRAGHRNYEIIEESKKVLSNGQECVWFLAKWPSKTGFDIFEYIFLVNSDDQVRTIAVRAAFNIEKKKAFYDGIIESFKPFKKAVVEK